VQALVAPQGAGERAQIKFIDDLCDATAAQRGFYLHD